MAEDSVSDQKDTDTLMAGNAPSPDEAPLLQKMFTMPPAKEAMREIFFLDSPHFSTLNIGITLIHGLCVVLEWKVIIPLASGALEWTSLGYMRVSWLAVFFSFFMYWFTFVIYGLHTSVQAKVYDGAIPRVHNRLKDTDKLSARLWGSHQNSIEFMIYITGAVTCACCVGDLTVVEEGGEETSKNTEVAAFALMSIFARVLHAIFYAGDVPYLRAIGYCIGLHSALYIYLGAIFNVWTGWAL